MRIRASAIRASWDELATMWQLIARGIIGYAPLVGTPSPSSLHAEDNAFALAILAGLCIRASVERSSLTAPRSVGGLQLASVVECAVGSVSSELMFLLNGGTLASDLARDALQEAMLSDPLTTDFSDGLVLKAMRFLSGYGIYLTVATDKLVGRMLDNYAARHKVQGHSLIVPFNAQAFAKAQKLCRVGAVANTIRLAINALRSRGSPSPTWRNSRAWRSVLPDNSCISDHACATLYCLAADDSRRDWSSECNIFRVGIKSLPEDAHQSAWEHPCDLRCNHLDAPCSTRDCEFALYGDGGYDAKLGAAFSAQVRYFQDGPLYFESSIYSERPVASRLPHRYGYEESTVHTAELSAMIAAMRWVVPDAHNMFVGDRSALFSALKEAADPCSLWPTKGACLPLEGRLRAILRRIAVAWSGECRIPRWKDSQIRHPENWEVRIPLNWIPSQSGCLKSPSISSVSRGSMSRAIKPIRHTLTRLLLKEMMRRMSTASILISGPFLQTSWFRVVVRLRSYVKIGEW